MNKKELINAIAKQLQDQLNAFEKEKDSVNNEIANETKSSAGDKFETAREMMNQEITRIEERIRLLKLNLHSLFQLPLSKAETVTNGSLVQCSDQFFFFGIPFGKLIFQATEILVLSLNSPIGKLFYGKKEGDTFTFLSQNYTILRIY